MADCAEGSEVDCGRVRLEGREHGAGQGDGPQSELNFVIFFNKRFYLFIFIGEGREKEWERNISVWLPLTCSPLGTWPTTQACAPTGNQSSNPLLLRLAFNPLNHPARADLNL